MRGESAQAVLVSVEIINGLEQDLTVIVPILLSPDSRESPTDPFIYYSWFKQVVLLYIYMFFHDLDSWEHDSLPFWIYQYIWGLHLYVIFLAF